jgi:hypothetical protein
MLKLPLMSRRLEESLFRAAVSFVRGLRSVPIDF